MGLGFVALALAAAVAAVLAWSAWQRRRRHSAAPAFAALMLASMLYALGYLGELAGSELPWLLFWVRIEYLGAAFVPSLFVLVVVHAVGAGHRLTRGSVLASQLVPVVVLTAALTTPLHELLYVRPQVAVNTAGFHVLVFRPGPIYWVHVAYSQLALLLATVLLLRMAVGQHGRYRHHAFTLLAGASPRGF